jgi:hypothetical protein
MELERRHGDDECTLRADMKRKPQLTKKERTALRRAEAPAGAVTDGKHIHCIACGIHLDPAQFKAPATATMLRCQHGSTFPSCVGCAESSNRLLEEHDKTGQAVQSADAWH